MRLVDLKAGDSAIISNLEGGPGFKKRLESFNIRVGKSVKVKTIQPLHGPVIIEIDGSQITIGRKMAERIILQDK